jgi:putative glutamine amidotransferase
MNWLVTVSAENLARPYLDWLRNGGVNGIAIWPGHQTTEIADADALLLAGGGDVAPWRYGAETEDETRNINEPRDEMEIELIRLFMAAGKPVFGICRGIQILNVTLGGGLIQHVPRRLAGATQPEQHPSVHKRDSSHDVRMDGGTRMGQSLLRVTKVNSAHHQAVDPARLAPGLRITCLSHAGIIEAIESSSPGVKLSAVQWHPERLPADHPASGNLLRFWIAITTQEAQ